MSKWYGKIMFRNEGVVTWSESESETEAQAFVNGFLSAKEITAQEDDDSLDDYWTAVDQLEPIEE